MKRFAVLEAKVEELTTKLVEEPTKETAGELKDAKAALEAAKESGEDVTDEQVKGLMEEFPFLSIEQAKAMYAKGFVNKTKAKSGESRAEMHTRWYNSQDELVDLLKSAEKSMKENVTTICELLGLEYVSISFASNGRPVLMNLATTKKGFKSYEDVVGYACNSDDWRGKHVQAMVKAGVWAENGKTAAAARKKYSK